MQQYDVHTMLVRPGNTTDPSVVIEVTPERAGWEFINFAVRQLAADGTWEYETGDNELAIVLLSGEIGVMSDRGDWPVVGTRTDVFSGPPSALYLPRKTTFTVMATVASEFAVAWVRTEEDHAPRHVQPADVEVEIQGW